MLKDGKISLDSAPVDATPVASTETTTESTSTETTITSATPVAIEVSSVSQVAVSNNNSPKGGVMDKLKWVLLALFVLLLALNYYRMSSMNSQLSDLQQKVKLLEETIQKISKA